jgi:DNA mismatch repair protein MutS2
MHAATLRALEFDRIVAAVRSFATTPLGASAVDKLSPLTDAQLVEAALSATCDGVRFLETDGPFGLDGPSDLIEILSALAIDNRLLDVEQLRGLATFLGSLGKVQTSITKASSSPYPSLQSIATRIRSFKKEVREIQQKTTSSGEVNDNATPQLKAIREKLRKRQQHLRNTLQSYLSGRETGKYLQEQIVTERGGRFVLVVRAEHRSAIPGIVHGASGSGASLFLEPLSTVDINNEIVAIEDDEGKEVHRILMGLANSLRTRSLDLRHSLEAATELDVIQSRANFSRLIDGQKPSLVSGTLLKLPKARHPLLFKSVRARAGIPPLTGATSQTTEPVPINIILSPPTTALIVTGPNTGGKTVALKTAGLLVAMAQTGILIPADSDANVPVFQSIFADIGDEQSIANNLSTYSGHITNIVTMDRKLELPSLVLLDEIGTGTDPTEGGALGAALIDHFRQRGALIIATTHDSTMKSYAETTHGVTSAGFGFDQITYEPTYQLNYGTPGRSLALEIASRLGISAKVIEDARSRCSESEMQLAVHLKQVEEELETLNTERRAIKVQRETLDHDLAALATRQRALVHREQRENERWRNALRDARQQVRQIIQKLRDEATALTNKLAADHHEHRKLSTGDTGTLKRKAFDELDAISTQFDEATPMQDSPSAFKSEPNGLTVGSLVRIDNLQLNGTVSAIHDSTVEVQARGKRIHVEPDGLQAITKSGDSKLGGVTLDLSSDDCPSLELNVVGCRVDEALSRVEKHVDQALLHEQQHLRIVHGHGTGQLRQAIRSFLEDHPLISKIEPINAKHGNSGVTIIELKK